MGEGGNGPEVCRRERALLIFFPSFEAAVAMEFWGKRVSVGTHPRSEGFLLIPFRRYLSSEKPRLGHDAFLLPLFRLPFLL